MSDDKIERPLHFIREKSKEYAKAKSNRVYLSEFRKSKKALLMIEAEKNGRKTAQERESYAYAHVEYQELLSGLKISVEIEEELSLEIEAAKLSVEIWRTKQANERAERHGYGAG